MAKADEAYRCFAAWAEDLRRRAVPTQADDQSPPEQTTVTTIDVLDAYLESHPEDVEYVQYLLASAFSVYGYTTEVDAPKWRKLTT